MTLHPLHDRLSNVKMRDVRDLACQVIDRIQADTAEHQVVALATLFHLVCERFDLPPRQGMEIAENVLKQARTFDKAHFEGLRMYIRNVL
jgi:hypothetical protein